MITCSPQSDPGEVPEVADGFGEVNEFVVLQVQRAYALAVANL